MKFPNISSNGCCPTCGGKDWKTAKMMFMGGQSTYDAESRGGGFGGGIGFGSGQSGLTLNYQGVNLHTTGTQTSGIGAAYSPPEQPKNYDSKDYLIDKCNKIISDACNAILNINQFALDLKSIKPGLLDFRHSEGAINRLTSEYLEIKAKLEQILDFENSLHIWEKTRVCARCGEKFLTQDEKNSVAESFEIPIFDFPGINIKCPSCHSYQWKTVDAFIKIKMNEAHNDVTNRENGLRKAIDDEKAELSNEGGIFKRLTRKLLSESPDEARIKLQRAKQLLDKVSAACDLLSKNKNLDGARVCSCCEFFYTTNI